MAKIVLWFGVSLAILTGILAVARQHFVINITDSLPPGLYLLKTSKILKRDNLVVFCPKLDQKTVKYLGVQDSLIKQLRRCNDEVISFTKPIAAIEGDTVEVTATNLFINGKPYAGLQPTEKIPHLNPGTYKVQPGTVWLVSQYNDLSFDSRYFGPVSVDQIIGNARPLWVSKKKSFCYAISEQSFCI